MFQNRRNSGFFKILLTALLSSLGMGVVFFILASAYISRNAPAPGPPQTKERADTPQPQQIAVENPAGNVSIAAAVAKSASPGVVGISVLRVKGDGLFDTQATEKWGLGSGVIVSPDGYILTNHHVAGGESKRLVVSLADGRNLEGITQWSDPVLDLAVVKVNASGLPTVPMGDATTLQVGEPAIAIGNPLGLEFQRTVTSGIISALNRTIKIETDQGTNYMEDLVQTDASINPGNSGGPLLNSSGQVVAINTVKVEGAEAMGFAIPINVAAPIIRKYIETGGFREAYMGIFAYDKAVIPYLDEDIKIDNGIYVATVDANSPAYQAGIREKCIIRQVDGIDVNTMMQLRAYIYSREPGDVIQVTHLMHGSNDFVTVPVKLASREREGGTTR